MLHLPIYMDYSSTTPVDKRVLDAMLPFFTTYFGNAASNNHEYGLQAAQAVKFARGQVANLLNAEPGEIIFTSGATEAINLAIKGVYENYISKGNHIITCVTEHRAVLDTCSYLEKKGALVTYLQVDKNGNIDLSQLENAITPNTILIALMYANNETGLIHPVRAIGEIAKRKKIIFFTDATQAIGKVNINVYEDGIDILAMSAHKFYGPKGVGCLYLKRKNPRVIIRSQIHGGGHEKELRSGTLNVPGIVALGKASEIVEMEMHEEIKKIKIFRDTLEKRIRNNEFISINADVINRLSNISNICIKGVDKNTLLLALNKWVAFSSGSACTSSKPFPSHVLKAMGLSDENANSSIRISLGRFSNEEDITFASEKILDLINILRI